MRNARGGFALRFTGPGAFKKYRSIAMSVIQGAPVGYHLMRSRINATNQATTYTTATWSFKHDWFGDEIISDQLLLGIGLACADGVVKSIVSVDVDGVEATSLVQGMVGGADIGDPGDMLAGIFITPRPVDDVGLITVTIDGAGDARDCSIVGLALTSVNPVPIDTARERTSTLGADMATTINREPGGLVVAYLRYAKETSPKQNRHALGVYPSKGRAVAWNLGVECAPENAVFPQGFAEPIDSVVEADDFGGTGQILLAVSFVNDKTTSAPVILSAPQNTVAPSITGTAQVEQILEGHDGTWTGNVPPLLTRQWKRAGVAIAGATEVFYPQVAADEGTVITYAVTGTNTMGALTATSAGTAPVEPAPPANVIPANTAPPVITIVSNPPKVGELMTWTLGTWDGYPPPTLASVPKLDGIAIPGVDGSVTGYTFVTGDTGKVPTVTVNATNAAGGPISATSAAVAAVVAVADPDVFDFYIDPIGGSPSGDGSIGSPWVDLQPMTAAMVNKRFGGKSGTEVKALTGKVIPAGCTIGSYGGSAPFTISGLSSVKGTSTADWTEVNATGVPTASTNWWRRAYTGPTFNYITFNRLRSYPIGGKKSSVASLNGARQWVITGGFLYVYSTSNPFTAFTTIENCSASDGLNFGIGCTVRNIRVYGYRTAVIPNSGWTHTDLVLRFHGKIGMLISRAGVYRGTGLTIWDHGTLSSGHHGLYPVGAVNAPFLVDIHFTNVRIDNSGEDNYQQHYIAVGSSIIIDSTVPGYSRFSAPNPTGNENNVDIKYGPLTMDGVHMDTFAPSSPCVTIQGYATQIRSIRSIHNARHSTPAIIMAEKESELIALRSRFWSSSGNPVILAQTGHDHSIKLCLLVGRDGNGSLRHGVGKLYGQHNSIIAYHPTAGGTKRAYNTQSGLYTITSLVHDSTNDGTGHYTATITSNTFAQWLPDLAPAIISGLTGASAAWNNSYATPYILENAAYGGGNISTATFKIPIAAAAPSPAVLTGMVFNTLPIVEVFEGNLLFGSAETVFFQGFPFNDTMFPNVLGANYIGSLSTNFVRNIGNYSSARVTSEVAAAGNLKFDSGGKVGGALWKVGSAPFAAPASVTSIVISGTEDEPIATVTTAAAHGLSAATMAAPTSVTIFNAAPDDLNGHQFVREVISPTVFTFEANRGLANQTATGTIVWTRWKPLAEAQGAPTYDLGAEAANGDLYGAPLGVRAHGAVAA